MGGPGPQLLAGSKGQSPFASFLTGAEALASDARLLLEADRLSGAALLHSEACALLLQAWLLISGADPTIVAPQVLPRGDALASRFRAVWLRRSETPNGPDLRAMADGLRGLVATVRDRAKPPAEPETVAPATVPTRVPAVEVVKLPPKQTGPRPATDRPKLPTPASPPAPRKPISSAAFWSLIDRWGMDDQDALALIGHAGGLTKRGTRPRFRLTGPEAERYHLLQTLDDALAALGQDARAWLRKADGGRAPLDAMLAGGDTAVRDETRRLVAESLRRSLR